MLYAIIGRGDSGNCDRRAASRPAHLRRLRALQDQGRMLRAGPFPVIDSEDPGPAGYSGSLIVAEYRSLEEARAWADADPYVAAGVYRAVEVLPFKKIFPS